MPYVVSSGSIQLSGYKACQMAKERSIILRSRQSRPSALHGTHVWCKKKMGSKAEYSIFEHQSSDLRRSSTPTIPMCPPDPTSPWI